MPPAPRPIAPAPGGQLELNDIVGRDDDVARFWDSLTRQSLVLPRTTAKMKSALTGFSTRLPKVLSIVLGCFRTRSRSSVMKSNFGSS